MTSLSLSLSQPIRADSNDHNLCTTPRLDSRTTRISTVAKNLARGSLTTETRWPETENKAMGEG